MRLLVIKQTAPPLLKNEAVRQNNPLKTTLGLLTLCSFLLILPSCCSSNDTSQPIYTDTHKIEESGSKPPKNTIKRVSKESSVDSIYNKDKAGSIAASVVEWIILWSAIIIGWAAGKSTPAMQEKGAEIIASILERLPWKQRLAYRLIRWIFRSRGKKRKR